MLGEWRGRDGALHLTAEGRIGGGKGSDSDRMVDESWDRRDMVGERARRYARCRVLVGGR